MNYPTPLCVSERRKRLREEEEEERRGTCMRNMRENCVVIGVSLIYLGYLQRIP
jgi:hypothetical protein